MSRRSAPSPLTNVDDPGYGHAVMPLDIGKCMEHFSDAYVRAVASAARMHVEPRLVDNDSVDGYLHYTGQLGAAYSPQIAFQLKATSVASHVKLDHIAYPLKIKNYDDLRVTNSGVPRILIVVVIPEGVVDWLLQDETRMRLHRCGYWFNLAGAPAVTNSSRRVVHVPRAQQFTVGSLRDMMTRIGQGGSP